MSDSFIYDKVTLGYTSFTAPALARFKNQVYLAWSSADNKHLNIARSSDGADFGQKKALSDVSIGAPALAVLNDRLFLAWTGSDRRLNVMSSADGFNFEHKVVLGETSDVGPSAAEFRHQLYLAWTGSGNNRLNVARSENGTNFAHKQTLNETSKFTPGLTGFVRVADVGVIVIGWTGTDAVQHLNTLSSSDGQTFGNKQTLQQTSPAGPALLFSPARFRWIVSIDGDHRINLFESSEKHQTSAETSIATPAAIPNYIAWTGTDAQHHLNVARLRPTIAATEAERAQEVKPEAGTGWE